MNQSKTKSLIEAIVNTLVGFFVSLGITGIVLPLYGYNITLQDNLHITVIFTISSILRSYVLRRVFNSMKG
jgi:hypothetical protein